VRSGGVTVTGGDTNALLPGAQLLRACCWEEQLYLAAELRLNSQCPTRCVRFCSRRQGTGSVVTHCRAVRGGRRGRAVCEQRRRRRDRRTALKRMQI
jgi:hypothetical protein